MNYSDAANGAVSGRRILIYYDEICNLGEILEGGLNTIKIVL